MQKTGFLFICFTLLLPFPSLASTCAPVPNGTVCVNKSCDTVGATTIDSDQKNIIACLKSDSGTYIWKSTSGTTGSTCTINQYERSGWNRVSLGSTFVVQDKQVFTVPCSRGISGNDIGAGPGWQGAKSATVSGVIAVQCQNGTSIYFIDNCVTTEAHIK